MPAGEQPTTVCGICCAAAAIRGDDGARRHYSLPNRHRNRKMAAATIRYAFGSAFCEGHFACK